MMKSKPWCERPQCRERGLAPRLKTRVVHTTACVSLKGERGVAAAADQRRDQKRHLRCDQTTLWNSLWSAITTALCRGSQDADLRRDTCVCGTAAITLVSVPLCSAPSMLFAPLRPRVP